MSITYLFDPSPFLRTPPHTPHRSPARRRKLRRDPRHDTFARVYARTHCPATAYRAAYGRLNCSGKLRTDNQAAALGRRVLANPRVAALCAGLGGWQPLFDPETGVPTFVTWEPPAGAVPTPRPRQRVRRHPSAYRYVRYCKAGSYQARVPLGANRELGRTKGDSVNLGLFTQAEHGAFAERAAGIAARAWFAAYRPEKGVDVPEAIEALKGKGLIPACVLPPRVFARPGGGFGARVRRRGAVVAEVGPFPTPGEAYRALAGVLTRAGTN